MYHRCIVLKAFEKLRGLSAYYRWWWRWTQNREVDSIDILTSVFDDFDILARFYLHSLLWNDWSSMLCW
jgi:hypothetical protein